MKPKKLVLKKTTVANLNRNDMQEARGGVLYTYDSCGLSARTCPTDILCESGNHACGCTGFCTMPCITVP